MTRNKVFFWTLFFIMGLVHIHAQNQPQLISKPDLQFPNEAVMGRVVGKVWLRILVGADGIPIKTKIIKRDPEMAYLFDNNSRKWGMQCKFTPATDNNDKPVPMWVAIPLSFTLDHFTPPQCIKQVEPTYPPEAREMGMEGWVGLAVFVKSNGEKDISQTVVVAREPANASFFDKAAKEVAYHSQYIPAGYEGNSIDGWCFIKVSFNISGKGIYEEKDSQ
jgi:outer membrane biosynthesis protein TonB